MVPGRWEGNLERCLGGLLMTAKLGKRMKRNRVVTRHK